MNGEQIEIQFPTPNRLLKSRLWFASGIVSHKVGVKGSVWTADGQEKLLDGCTLRYSAAPRPGGGQVLRWLIKFAGNLQGNFLLRVAWAQNPEVSDQRPFRLTSPTVGFGIDDPDDDDDITPYANSFFANGTLGGHSLTLAQMITQNGAGAAVDADFYYEDWDANVWTVQFPPLGEALYKLEVSDASPDTKTRSRLLVDFP
jgi:hypothetical protein